MPQTQTRSRAEESTQFEGNTPPRQIEGERHPGRDLLEYAKAYARDNPGVAALWCFGLGFIVGWRLKPW